MASSTGGRSLRARKHVNYKEQLPEETAESSSRAASEDDDDFIAHEDLAGGDEDAGGDEYAGSDEDVDESGIAGDDEENDDDGEDEDDGGDDDDGEDSDVAGPPRKRKRSNIVKDFPRPKSSKARVRKQPQKTPGLRMKSRRPTVDQLFVTQKTDDFDYTENEIEMDTARITGSQGPMEIETDADLVHLQMFNNVVGSLKCIRPDVKPSRDDTASLESFLQGPVVGNRRWTSSVVSWGVPAWKVCICDHGRPANKKGHNESLEILKSAVPNKADAEEIGETFCRLMERIPFPTIANSKGGEKAMYKALCTRHVFPGQDIQLPSGHWTNSPLKSGDREYRSEFRSIDPVTGKSFLTIFTTNTGRVSVHKPIPRLPAYFKTTSFTPSGQGLTHEEKEKQRYVFDLTNYILSKLHGIVGTKEAIHTKKQLLEAPFMSTKWTKLGPYGGQPLFKTKVDVALRKTRIEISGAVYKSLENIEGGSETLPIIWVNGLARTRSKQVVQILTQTWMRTGNIFECWKAGCQAADYLNMVGADIAHHSGSTCSCTPDQRMTECHLCDLCGKISLCQNLSMNASGTALACDDCRDRNPAFLRDNVRRNIRDELSALNLQGNLKAEVDEAIQDIEKNWNQADQTWISHYTHTPMSEKLMGRRKRDPFTPSVDGVFPVFHDGKKDSGLRYHTPGNLATCELFVNELKEQFPPGILHFIAKRARSRKTDVDRQELIKAMNDIYIVRRKIAQRRRYRLEKAPVDVNAWEDTKQELLTCQPYSMAKTSRRPFNKYHSKPNSPASKDFRPNDLERIEQVIAEIEDAFDDSDRVLHRSEDGCPFPFPGETVPDDWCWWSAWATFEEKLCRLWLECNGYWVTFDNIETLFLETIFQFFSPTDVDPLHIDALSPYYGHPLRAVLAKRVHNRQMETAWKNKRPNSFADRGPSNTGNISFEPHIINTMKMDYADETHDEMVTRIKSINLSKNFFDPDYKSKSKAKGKKSATYVEDDDEELSDVDDDLDDDFGDELGEGDQLFVYDINAEPEEGDTMAIDNGEEDEVVEIPESEYNSDGERVN